MDKVVQLKAGHGCGLLLLLLLLLFGRGGLGGSFVLILHARRCGRRRQLLRELRVALLDSTDKSRFVRADRLGRDCLLAELSVGWGRGLLVLLLWWVQVGLVP